MTTPPLDLPAELLPVLRDMAKEVAAIHEGARMPVEARDLLALIERAEADRRHAKFYGDKATEAETRANLAEGKLDSLQMSLDLWRDRAEAAEKAVAELEQRLAPIYTETPRGHIDAWADTREGYTISKGWTIKCIWCVHESHGSTKAEALAGYEAHEEWILNRAALDGTA